MTGPWRVSSGSTQFIRLPEFELQMGQGEQCVCAVTVPGRASCKRAVALAPLACLCVCMRARSLRLAECRHLGNDCFLACRVSLSPRPHLQIRLLPPRLCPYQLDSSQVRQLLRDKSPLTSVALSFSFSTRTLSTRSLSLEDCPDF